MSWFSSHVIKWYSVHFTLSGENIPWKYRSHEKPILDRNLNWVHHHFTRMTAFGHGRWKNGASTGEAAVLRALCAGLIPAGWAMGAFAQTLSTYCLFSESLSCFSYWGTNKAAEVKEPQLPYLPGERIRGFLFFRYLGLVSVFGGLIFNNWREKGEVNIFFLRDWKGNTIHDKSSFLKNNDTDLIT